MDVTRRSTVGGLAAAFVALTVGAPGAEAAPAALEEAMRALRGVATFLIDGDPAEVAAAEAMARTLGWRVEPDADDPDSGPGWTAYAPLQPRPVRRTRIVLRQPVAQRDLRTFLHDLAPRLSRGLRARVYRADGSEFR